jgi:hypothetical protein
MLDPRLNAFIAACDSVAAGIGIARATLSTRPFMDGKRIDALASGQSDIGIGRLARAERELDMLRALVVHSLPAA